jgi:hypothetical protein
MELRLVGQTFHFLNVFVILSNDIFILELIKRNQIWLLKPATVPKPLIEPNNINELETTLL